MMETIVWGALGGLAALALENIREVAKLPAIVWRGNGQLMSSISYYYYEGIEGLKDLVAESMMEYEAEEAAIEEVRVHGGEDFDQAPDKSSSLKLVN